MNYTCNGIQFIHFADEEGFFFQIPGMPYKPLVGNFNEITTGKSKALNMEAFKKYVNLTFKKCYMIQPIKVYKLWSFMKLSMFYAITSFHICNPRPICYVC